MSRWTARTTARRPPWSARSECRLDALPSSAGVWPPVEFACAPGEGGLAAQPAASSSRPTEAKRLFVRAAIHTLCLEFTEGTLQRRDQSYDAVQPLFPVP